MIYEHAFSTIDPNASGEVSVNMLVKVLETSALSAAMIDRVGHIHKHHQFATSKCYQDCEPG